MTKFLNKIKNWKKILPLNRYYVFLKPQQRTFRLFKRELSSSFFGWQLLDPDPDSQSGSADPNWIRIRNTAHATIISASFFFQRRSSGQSYQWRYPARRRPPRPNLRHPPTAQQPPRNPPSFARAAAAAARNNIINNSNITRGRTTRSNIVATTTTTDITIPLAAATTIIITTTTAVAAAVVCDRKTKRQGEEEGVEGIDAATRIATDATTCATARAAAVGDASAVGF